jgi:hypothetical protein
MKTWLGSALAAGALVLAAGSAQASIVWDWSFQGEAGAFTTDGNALGGVAAAGTYTLTDFSATSTATGMPLGSVSGGEYTQSNGFVTDPPYSFTWDGSAVTSWLHSGANDFHWWVFQSTAQSNLHYFFGWATGNVNDPTRAAAYDANIACCDSPLSEGQVSVSVAGASTVVPEPATWALLLAGFFGLGASLRQRRAAVAPV